MTTLMLDQARTDDATTAPTDVRDVAGGLEDELFEQAVGEQVAGLTTMPSISTIHCLTSRHDTTLLPRL
ncbi:hypothetical protein [Nocardioides alkalitolerans]|uniref:hypothetical protein n=1 Tax=Nocardioides alkalitolerans TaxID=281714 RepID=UPI0012FA07AB|nr:hypothetical protein [Nocardioides alkalitolerans]